MNRDIIECDFEKTKACYVWLLKEGDEKGH